jgi:hypothetical protein
MARPPGEAADDGNLGKVRQWRFLFRNADLHDGVDELALEFIGILALVLLNPA